MLLAEIARTSADVARTPARLEKVQRLAACLAELRPDEIPVAVAYLAGELPQGSIGIGWASLRDLPPPAPASKLEVLDVDAALERIAVTAGAGSQRRRRDELAALFARATEAEQQFLRGAAHRRASPGRARRSDGGRGRARGRRAGRRTVRRALDAGRRAAGGGGSGARARAATGSPASG